MKFCFLWIMIFSLFFYACTEKHSPSANKREPLKKAQSFYEGKKWKEAALEFESSIQECNEMEEYEARLGSIVCRLFDKDPQWEAKIKLWKPDTRAYWYGLSFTILETLPLDRREDIEEIIRKTDIPFAYFLLMQFLLLEGYESFIPSLVQKMPSQQKLAWDLLLITAWHRLKQKQGNQGEALFEIIYQNAISPEQKKDAACGILLGNFFCPEQKKEVSLPKDWEYYMDLKKTSIFRSSSSISGYQKSLNEVSPSLQSSLIFYDILFTFGGYLRNPIPLWEKGLELLESHKPEWTKTKIQGLYDSLRKRFFHAIGWFYLIKGDFEIAEKNFLFESENGQKEKEIIPLAIMAWKEGANLSEIAKKFPSSSWQEEYSLGGKKVSFYRLPSRESKREEYEKLWKEPLHKMAFLFLDIFCLTGDGRSAHILLDQIVSEFPEDIYSLYIEEEENIPKDPYAENQIWEKLD